MDKKNLSKKIKPTKSLVVILKKRSGRDNSGQISVRHQGGRQKRFYRMIDFQQVLVRVKFEVSPQRAASIGKYYEAEITYTTCGKRLEFNGTGIDKL